ncbi:helix-turn-helix transcriptional regulator [Methyloraptor flagellatus]|uniref:Helix-turn-helix transcriptional regulator n=1 Tax=Methyloraptor flagellatus TaxID=3162530 RepID=A0AAU7XE98_9HYPH
MNSNEQSGTTKGSPEGPASRRIPIDLGDPAWRAAAVDQTVPTVITSLEAYAPGVSVHMLLDGELLISHTEDRRHRMVAGAMLIACLPTGGERRIFARHQKRLRWIEFQADATSGIDRFGIPPAWLEADKPPHEVLLPMPAELVTRALGLFETHLPPPLGETRRGAEVLLAVCDVIAAVITDTHAACPALARSNALFTAAVELMESRLHEPLSVADLCAALGTNRNKLTALFRARADASPMEYLGQLRLRRARVMVLTRDLPLGEIAHRVGYRQQSSFTRAFRQLFGETPRGMRAGVEHATFPAGATIHDSGRERADHPDRH